MYWKSKTTKLVSHAKQINIVCHVQHPNTEIWNIMGHTIDNLIPINSLKLSAQGKTCIQYISITNASDSFYYLPL